MNSSGENVTESKTVYDPNIHSDEKMLDLSQKVGQKAFELYSKDPSQYRFDIQENGIRFSSYINKDPRTGAPYIGNVHPIG